MHVPWWIWLLVALAALVWLFLRGAGSWRAALRRELIEYLGREEPDLVVTADRESYLVLEIGGGDQATLHLERLYRQASQLPADDLEGRRALFQALVGAYRDHRETLEPDSERDRARLRPRLVTSRDVEALSARLAEGEIPAVDVGVAGLRAVLVLDAEHSVSYVHEAVLGELGLSLAEAFALARENLRRTTPRELVRRILEDGSLNVVKTLDSYDAARLLVVPEYLEAGDRVIALVPDRDTLVLLREPDEVDLRALRRLARNADGEPLWPEPLRVTSAGVEPL